MTIEHIQAVVKFYDDVLKKDKVDCYCDNDSRSSYHRVSHIRWMCQEILEQEDADKANRWLGFVQGVLWAEGYMSIDEMRGHNRDIKNIEEHYD